MNTELPIVRENEFAYDICFCRGYDLLSQMIKERNLSFHRVCIVSDSQVAPLYLEQLKAALDECCTNVTFYVFPAGEEQKNLDTVQGLYEHLIQEGFDRRDMLAALGGGVTGDLTGFTAATYLRGIPFMQFPTSLLSQVDSSIGGKTGVDFRNYKNMVGAFYQPSLVYMNLDTLSTLNEEQFSCGMGEILKAGLIRDMDFFRWLLDNHREILDRNPQILQEMIYRSCQIKKIVVENDPLERGERAILNLGHTIGHAVEKLKEFQMLHGQCVALGYVAAAYISMRRGLLSPDQLQQIREANTIFGLPNDTRGLDAAAVLAATKKDKKMSRGAIKFILLEKMGNAIVDDTVSDPELLEAIRYILGETGGICE